MPGALVSARDLVATQYADGAVMVALRDVTVTDSRSAGQGFRISLPTQPDAMSASRVAPLSLDAAPYWGMIGQNCFASLFRGVSHMDACYKLYKMYDDGIPSYDYWRLDWYATIFTASSYNTLYWGRIHADQDGGPTMSWVDWSLDQDYDGPCTTLGLSITVAGVGGGFSKTLCELQDISKNAGTTFGYFQDYWSWGDSIPQAGRDKALAMLLGTRTPQNTGWPVWGLSWDFALF